ncbi:MAG: hypothetical protein WD638_08100 [Nitriliruptoraceae bacterium]
MRTTSLWDVYLDAADAYLVLEASHVLESERAIREPLPLHEAPRLLARLRTITRISAEEADSWALEADERTLEAEADGGRWGSAETAARMAAVARELAAGSRRVATAALRAADDLEPRIQTVPSPEAQAAAEATLAQARQLLARHDQRDGEKPDPSSQ